LFLILCLHLLRMGFRPRHFLPPKITQKRKVTVKQSIDIKFTPCIIYSYNAVEITFILIQYQHEQ
jgi:hypothetical protein